MKKGLVITIFICVLLFFVGGILILVGLLNGGTFAYNIDYKNHKISSGNNREMVSGDQDVDEFKNIDLAADYAAVRIKKGDNYHVKYHVYEEDTPTISVEDGTLKIKAKAEKGLNLNLGIFTENNDPYIEITVPENAELNDATIETNAGDVEITAIDFDELNLDVDAGQITVSDSDIETFTVDNNAGSIDLSNVDSEKIEFTVDFGGITIDGSDIDSAVIEVNAGDIDIKDSKIDKLDMDIDAGSADVKLHGEKADYTFDINVDAGEISVDGDNKGKKYNDGGDKEKKISAEIDAGSIDIDFE